MEDSHDGLIDKFAIVVLLLLKRRRVLATVVKVVNQSVSNVQPLRQCGCSGGVRWRPKDRMPASRRHKVISDGGVLPCMCLEACLKSCERGEPCIQ